MTSPERSWLSRALLILVLGPLPVGILALCADYFHILNQRDIRPVTAGFGAVWGLSAGILRKSLGRAVVGAAMGLSFGSIVDSARNEYVAAFLLILHGAALCAIINFDRRREDAGLIRGAVAGAISFGAMGFSAIVVAKFFRPNLLGWTVMSLVPFGLGMFLFLRLIAHKPDDLPVAASAPKVPSDEQPV